MRDAGMRRIPGKGETRRKPGEKKENRMAYLAYVTVPDRERALAIARTLVETRLAAGVNVLPGATSVYRWRGEIRETGECLLFAQVSREAFPCFCETVRRHHCHEVPCIVALPLQAGHTPFVRWIEENSLPG
ncbi:MAG: divalent-cation tolerance protein CutA [Desulfovibrio sp.]|jgi:periplasmic divalent cation tolerance protein|nr:divalent-cation tolerance protein CutA [Desulfovibrio sp.]